VPAVGYGIRYEFGIFDQDHRRRLARSRNRQMAALGNPWELVRPEWAVEVKSAARTEQYTDETIGCGCAGCPTRRQRVPYDTPILGYQTKHG